MSLALGCGPVPSVGLPFWRCYCFAVDDCSQMVAGGADPLAVAAYLYGVELDTGKLSGKKVPLCSMEPGPKTNPQQCPWSIELA